MNVLPTELAVGRVNEEGLENVSLGIQRAARNVLNSPLMRYVTFKHGNSHYYIAAASSDFANIPGEVTCPLAGCLPGSPRFQGPAAYLVPRPDGSFTGLFVTLSAEERGHFNIRKNVDVDSSLEAEAASLGLEVIHVPTETRGEPWVSAEELLRTEYRQTFRRWLLSAFALACVTAGVAVLATVAKAGIEPVVVERREAAQAALHQAAEELQAGLKTEAPRPLKELDTLVGVVKQERQGSARLVSYRHARGATEYELELPLSADYDQFRALKAMGRFDQMSRDGYRVLIRKDNERGRSAGAPSQPVQGAVQ